MADAPDLSSILPVAVKLTKSCSNCIHVREGTGPNGKPVLLCWFNPPTVQGVIRYVITPAQRVIGAAGAMTPYLAQAELHGTMTMQPEVAADQRCGQHAPMVQ